MDPPWCNKSVRRGSKYKTSTNDEIFSWIPFETLLSPSGYVSIWITNKNAIETFIRNHFDKINLKYKGEWKWIKSGINELESGRRDRISRIWPVSRSLDKVDIQWRNSLSDEFAA